MPPKKGNKKAAPEKDTIQLPRTEEEKLLERECRVLKQQWDKERFFLTRFQKQAELTERYWNLEKRNHDGAKMELRGKFVLKEDLEERQGFEMRLYQEKLKHLLHEQQADTTEVRTETERALGGLQDLHREEIKRVNGDTRALLVRSKDMSTKFGQLTTELKKGHEGNIGAMREDTEHASDCVRLEYEGKMRQFRREEEEERKRQVTLMEKRLNDHISLSMQTHQEEYAEIKDYYSDVTHSNLDLIKTLKSEVQETQKTCKVKEKALSEIMAVNRKLSEPFKGYVSEVQRLKFQMENHAKDKDSLKITQDKVETITTSIEQLTWENEVTTQKMEKLKEELGILTSKRDLEVERVMGKQGLQTMALQQKVSLAEARMQKTRLAWQELCRELGRPPERPSQSLEELDARASMLGKQVREATGRYHGAITHFEDVQRRFLGHIEVEIERNLA